ncbi:MAG TPA: PAS domain S-box protein [Candidatus Hydrogenedentes bacterium]|mgnify:FL=1|nr:PAS domain S-box protein [Candidatus Hydrogenedentota bacterium]
MSQPDDTLIPDLKWPQDVSLSSATFQELFDRPFRVLLADDEETIVVSSLELFRQEGWEGDGARSAEEALERIEGQEFDVAIVDYKMPGNENLALLQRLTDRYPHLPVIIITGFPSLESAIVSVQQKAFDYVTKPLDMGYLLRRAREAGEYCRLRKALFQSEQRYQSLIDDVLEVSQVALMIVDAEHRVAWMNRAMERFFSFQRQNTVGKPVKTFIVEEFKHVFENPEEFERVMLAAYENNAYPEHFECQVVETDERKARWLEHWSQPIVSGLYAGGRIEQYVDISTRKRAEDDLRESKERFRLVADFTYDWEIWLGPKEEILYISPSCRRITGYEPQDFISDPSLLVHIAHPEDRPALEEHYRTAPRATECQTIEFRIVTKDKRVRWLNHVCQPVHGTDGQALGRRASFRDITAKHEAEQELRKREAILEAIGFAAGQFLQEERWEDTIEIVLERFGAASGVSRITIFQNLLRQSGEYFMQARFAWSAPEMRGTIDTPPLQGLPYRESGLSRWESLLARGECVLGNVREFPPQERRLLLQQEVASILVIPLFAGRQWWGFIGFEESVCERTWTRTEVEALRAAADTLGAAIQRQQTEDALRSQEAFMRQIREATLDAVEVIDTNGVIVWRNTVAGELYGNEVGSKCYENLKRDSRCPECAHLAIQQDGVPRDYECTVVDRRGRTRTMWVRATPLLDAKGNITAVVEISRDITERKRMEEALRESQERLTLSLAGSGLGLWDYDLKTGQVYRDERWTAILGYSNEELLTHRFDTRWLLHPDDIPPLEEAWSVHLAGQTPFCEVQIRMKRQSGAWRWMLMRGQVVERDDSGAPVRAAGSIRDVTEIVNAEREQKRLSDRMRQTHKLDSLAVLAGGVAHDFNNLLMGIMGNAHLALSEAAPGSPVRRYLTEIETIARRAALLANQMLAYAGQGQFAARALDVSEMIQDMAPLLTACVPRRVHLRYDLRDDLPAVMADDRQLRQMVVALVDNAREAIGSRSGEIRIRTDSIDADSTYLANTYVDDELQPGEYLCLEIADNGEGIPEDVLPKIFDPFFTTRLAGRGLGLSAVLGIVRGHNGAIRVDSQPGVGARFTVLLPGSRVKPKTAVPPPAGAGQWRGKGMVLLVDDEESVLRVGEGLLKRLGFGVLKAHDGVEALEVFDRHADVIACVILDVSMPNMGGEEAFLELRERKPDLPIVISSGYMERDVAERFAGQKLTAFLHKPYTGDELRETLRKTLVE